MDSVARMTAIYLVLLLLFRFAGKRTLSQLDTFDFVLLLIISEATQQAILGEDFSVTNAILTIGTIIFLNMTLSIVKQKVRWFSRLSEDVPIVIVKDGKPLQDRLGRERIAVNEVLEQARLSQGVERLDQIKWAILEQNGSISIIPK